MPNKSSFLARVAAAVRSGNRHRQPAGAATDPTAGYLGGGADPVGRLADELRAVGAHPRGARSPDELADAVRTIVREFSVRKAVLSGGPVMRALGVAELLRQMGVTASSACELAALDEPARRETLFAAELGVAAPDWAIAESGTLVYASGPEQLRSVSLLPPVHLAIVDARCVLPDLFDLPERLAELAPDGVPPGNVTLVTGPSKTGDIELRLTTGVHGPGELHVLIWNPRPL